MLSKQNRLSRRDFLSTKKNGKTERFAHFSIVVCPNRLNYSRFAVVTSSKLDKKAVIRNRLRRRIYDILKVESSGLGLDVIIFPQKSMLKLNNEETRLVLDPFLSKISLMA